MFNLYADLKEALKEENLNTELPSESGGKWKKVELHPEQVEQYVTGGLPDGQVVSRLRFDVKADSIESAVNHMYMDALDLVVNGDISNGEDALLKALDGMMKRGKVPKAGALIQTIAFVEKENEYTVWALLWMDWSS